MLFGSLEPCFGLFNKKNKHMAYSPSLMEIKDIFLFCFNIFYY